MACHKSCLYMIQSSDFLHSKVSIPIATLSHMCLSCQVCLTTGQPASVLFSKARQLLRSALLAHVQVCTPLMA